MLARLAVALLALLAVVSATDMAYISSPFVMSPNMTLVPEAQLADIVAATAFAAPPSLSPSFATLPTTSLASLTAASPKSLFIILEQFTPEMTALMTKTLAVLATGTQFNVSGTTDSDHIGRILTASEPSPASLRNVSFGLTGAVARHLTALSAHSTFLQTFLTWAHTAKLPNTTSIATVLKTTCGVNITRDETDGSFTVDGVKLPSENADRLAELAGICALSVSDATRLVVVSLSAPASALAAYGETAADKYKSIVAVADTVVAHALSGFPSHVAVITTASSTYAGPKIDTTLAANLIKGSNKTPTRQIMIWLVIGLILVIVATFIAVLQVGHEATKDTLLYRSTATFH